MFWAFCLLLGCRGGLIESRRFDRSLDAIVKNGSHSGLKSGKKADFILNALI